MNHYTVMIQQEFHDVYANSEIEAARMIEDLVKSGGHSPYMKIFVGNIISYSPVED